MTEVRLDGARILAVVSELVATPMPEHVAVNQEAKLSSFSRSSDHPLIACGAPRSDTNP